MTDEPDAIRQLRDLADMHRASTPPNLERADALEAKADLMMRMRDIPSDPSPLARLIRLCDSLKMAATASDAELSLDLSDDQLEILIEHTLSWVDIATERARRAD